MHSNFKKVPTEDTLCMKHQQYHCKRGDVKDNKHNNLE